MIPYTTEINDDGNECGSNDSYNGYNDTNTYICPLRSAEC